MTLRNTLTGVPVDDREFLGLLLDLGAAGRVSAEGTGLDAAAGSDTFRCRGNILVFISATRDRRGVGQDRPALGADDPLHHRDFIDADLPDNDGRD